MSLTFISNVTEESHQEQINKQCSLLWNAKKESAIKIFFFIRDKESGKNQPIAFTKIMTWLFLNHEKVFYKNLSLVVGQPKSQIINSVKSEKMLKKEWEKHEKILDYFIEEEYKDTFRTSWKESTKHQLLEAYKLPEYGEWEDLIDIAENIKTIQKNQDKKLFYTIINIFANKIRKDLKQNKQSKAWIALTKYPLYENFIKDNNIITHSYDTLKEQNNKLPPQNNKKGKYLDFIERYAFVNV